MVERDEKILRHIGLYRVSLRAVIEQLFFDGKSSDHVIQRLLAEGHIQNLEGLPGGLSYYQLTLRDARRLQIPDHRTRPHDTAALREALTVLWFCCMTEKQRKRIDRNQISKLFGRGKGFGKPHCAQLDGDKGVIRRIYTPGPNSRDDYLISVLRTDAEEALSHPKLAQWVAAKTFGFAILVETPGRKKAIERLLARKAPWPISLHVELVPGLGDLAQHIRERSGYRSSEPNQNPLPRAEA